VIYSYNKSQQDAQFLSSVGCLLADSQQN